MPLAAVMPSRLAVVKLLRAAVPPNQLAAAKNQHADVLPTQLVVAKLQHVVVLLTQHADAKPQPVAVLLTQHVVAKLLLADVLLTQLVAVQNPHVVVNHRAAVTVGLAASERSEAACLASCSDAKKVVAVIRHLHVAAKSQHADALKNQLAAARLRLADVVRAVTADAIVVALANATVAS